MPKRAAGSAGESMGHGLADVLADSPAGDPGPVLRRLVDAGLDRLPLPGAGHTLDRWRALAQVAAHDLALAKLYEGHTDALAILAELGGAPFSTDSMWAVWCAEMPDAQLRIFDMPAPPLCKAGQRVRVGGRKSWCSGAQAVTHALVSARDGQDRQCLLAVAMDQPGVSVTREGWQAVGMRDSGSVDVLFDDAQGTLVGLAGEYTGRPGFWHGAAGIAACWYGAMARIAGYLRHGSRHGDPYRLAHLGAVDAAVWGAAQVLRQAAGEIDAHPLDSCKLQVFRARLAVEAAAHDVMERASRGLGAGPLCRDAAYARLMADLPVFVRQSHAEHDQAVHGSQVQEAPQTLWEL